jgi:flagellar L-ring protein FlgH
MNCNIISVIVCVVTTGAFAQQQAAAPDAAPSSSLLATVPLQHHPAPNTNEAPHGLRMSSMFAIAPPMPRTFEVHDLVQIIVRETSQAKSSQDLKTKKDSKIDGSVGAWPDLNLSDILNLQARAGRTSQLPAVNLEFTKDFKGEGDYDRKDDLTARLTAEVIDVLPNGNLILEARTNIKTDKEEQSIKVTGICRPEDITGANTILSNQLHDLIIEKTHKGELRDAGSKGIISKVMETIFAF